jgi:hypothetical protein
VNRAETIDIGDPGTGVLLGEADGLQARKGTIMLQQGSAFNGFTIEASNGRIGTVTDFLFDDATWKLRWLVVETGDWLKNRQVLVHPTSIEKADIAGRALLVKLTRRQVEDSPGIATDEPVSKQMEEKLYSYYGVDPLWAGAYYPSNAISAPMSAPLFRSANTAALKASMDGDGDAHLRSLKAVTSYNISATDGKIGHVENFLFDDATWDIRYVVADTRNWWFGHHVLLSPASVIEIIWERHEVRLNLTCYKIKGSPPWEATGLLDRAYEQLLHSYYELPAHHLPALHKVREDITAD